MKFCKGGKVSLSLMSPPARGAWIEITLPSGCLLPGGRSPPARGAWIEILSSLKLPPVALVSPPARGAWIEIAHKGVFLRRLDVAPRTGGVD